MHQSKSIPYFYTVIIDSNPGLLNTTLRTLIWIFVLATLNNPVFGQNSANPFELTPRLDPSQSQENASEETGNPFDMVGTSTAAKPRPAATRKSRPKVGAQEAYQRFLFVVVISLLVLLTLLMTGFRAFFQRAYSAFINDTMMNQVYRDRESAGPIPYWVWYIYFFLNAGLLLFFVLRLYDVVLSDNFYLQWIYCTAGVAGLFLLKHLLLNITGFIFPVEKEIQLYNFLIVIFGIVIGLLLTPINILLAYGPENFFRTLIFITFGLLGLIYGFRYLRGIFIANRFIVFRRFHFLLYICTVEIAPVMVLVKLIWNQI